MCERQAGAEIEVTDEMVQSGLTVLYNSGIVDGQLGADSLVLEEIYRAMAAASHRSAEFLD